MSAPANSTRTCVGAIAQLCLSINDYEGKSTPLVPQKNLSPPVTTMADTAGSPSQFLKDTRSSSISCADNAFRAAGRFSVITPTPSTVEMSTSGSLLMMVTQVKREEMMDRFRMLVDENKSGLCRCFCGFLVFSGERICTISGMRNSLER